MKSDFTAQDIVVCNRGAAGLQIARLTGTEQYRFDIFAGEYGSKLDGRFDELIADESCFSGRDRLLTNVSFADGVEFNPGESICLRHITIERTGDKFKVVAAEQYISENVKKIRYLASAERIVKRFVNVAVRNIKKVSRYDYYILEIGRLTCGEVCTLKEIFRHTSSSNDDIVNDETKGEVVVNSTPVPELFSRYHMATICVYWPKCPLAEGTVNDAVAITLESHDGNYRPTVRDITIMNAATNALTKNWFERFPFEAKNNTPIKIRLNGVFAVKITHEHNHSDDRTTIEFSLYSCSNYHQAVEDIGKALTVREGEPNRGISWNPSMKLLEVAIQNENSDDISRIAPAHLYMLELQYNPDNGAWGINMLHEIPYHGGFVYANPERRNGKTAELKRQLNAVYGLGIKGYIDTDIAGEAMRYCLHDVAIQESMWRARQKKSEEEETMKFGVPRIKQLIFDDPTTVVIWEDGTKTIVHARDEKFDPEKGLAMAISRKALGNGREYYTYMQRQIKKGLRDSEGRKKKNKPAQAKKSKSAPKKKGGKK